MHTKKNAPFLIIVALSMLILTYITFCTVYEQILSKSNGFFNVILFGVVLILVFIFITLLARVITINPGSVETSPILSILIHIGIIGIFVFFAWLRLKYTSSVSPNESFTYRAAEYISNNNLSEGNEIHSHLINFPADFTYSLLVASVFNILGVSINTYTIVNLAMMLIAAIFIYNTVNLISSEACAVFAVIFFMFMPNNSFLVYSYNSELFVTANLMVVVFLYELMVYKRFKSSAVPVLISVICGIFSGICLSSEPVLIIAFIVLSCFVIKAERQNAICVVFPHIIAIGITGGLAVLKATLLNCDILDVLKGMGMCFVPTFLRTESSEPVSFMSYFTAFNGRFNDPSRFMDDNFYFLTNLSGKSFSANQAVWLDIADQLIYIFMLILCVLCIVYILRVSYDKIMTSFGLLISLFVCQILGGMNSVNSIYFFAVIIIIASSTLYYIYLNHHNDYATFVVNLDIENDLLVKRIANGEEIIKNDDGDDSNISELDEEYLLRARSLIFIGENDALYTQIKNEEKIARLNNPVVATRIKTMVNEEGEYHSVEESVEYFDELDEVKPKNQEVVHEVTAIPATRPVEVVKPQLADEYLDTENAHKNAESQGFVFRNKNNTNTNTTTNNNETNVSNETNVNTKSNTVSSEDYSKESIAEDKKAKKNNSKREKKKGGSLADIKPGEPLPNPLAGPKKHVAKDLDFDIDISDDDDFDV